MKLQMWLLLLVIFVISTSTANLRLSDGDLAEHGQFPFVAYLLHAADGGLNLCTASIISKTWAITAAHCTPLPTHFSFLTAGVVDTDDNTPYKQQRVVKRVIRHPNYEVFTIEHCIQAYYDVSLLQVETPFVWNEYVKPMRLNGDLQAYKPEECVAIGFGMHEKVYAENEPCASGELRYLNLTSDIGSCMEKHPDETFADHHLCFSVDYRDGEEPAEEGFGGPLVCQNKQVGVASSSFRMESNMTINHVYTSISHVYQWIRSNIYLK